MLDFGNDSPYIPKDYSDGIQNSSLSDATEAALSLDTAMPIEPLLSMEEKFSSISVWPYTTKNISFRSESADLRTHSAEVADAADVENSTSVEIDDSVRVGDQKETEGPLFKDALLSKLFKITIPSQLSLTEFDAWCAHSRETLGIIFEPVAELKGRSDITSNGSAEPIAASVAPKADNAALPPLPRHDDGSPALWSLRGDDCALTAIGWIRKFYGQVREDGSWDSMGLTRAQLSKIDPALCTAYTGQIRRRPSADLGLLKQPRTKSVTAEEALEKRRASNRLSYRKRQELKAG